jgi:signal peptidase II
VANQTEAGGDAPQASGAPEPVEAGGAPLAEIPGDRLGTPIGAARTPPNQRGSQGGAGPSYVFLVVLALATLAADMLSKTWAASHLDKYPGTLEVWPGHLTLILAKNRGGAWGLLQTTSENVRRPFFLLVSVAAITFIMSLYRKLTPKQHSLKWGLPLVLGGALGNVVDRIRFGHVIDFIDAHIGHGDTERHWPTFNVADIAICVGVGLMALDMFGSKRGPAVPVSERVPPAQSGEPAADWSPPPDVNR